MERWDSNYEASMDKWQKQPRQSGTSTREAASIQEMLLLGDRGVEEMLLLGDRGMEEMLLLGDRGMEEMLLLYTDTFTCVRFQ